MDEDAFLRVIADAPRDTATRLVYADWLRERGESMRADYLRLECEWAALPVRPEPLRSDEPPSTEDCYPPVLRELTELARGVALEWLLSVSLIGGEIRALVERFAARVPLDCVWAVTDAAAHLANWRAAVAEVRGAFAGLVGEQVTRERFAVPVDYALFLLVVDGLSCPEEYGMTYFDSLWSPGGMAHGTTSDCSGYADDHGRGEHLAGCGLWLCAGYRDKHDFHVCCDRDSPLFGAVADMHDSHPWMSPPHGPQPHEVDSWSFLEFLRWRVDRAEQDESGE